MGEPVTKTMEPDVPVARSRSRTERVGRASRRSFVRAGATVAIGLAAGCLGGGGGDDDSPLIDHPAATDLGDQPRLGPDPAAAEATVIVFEDPSCPSCQVFERRTFPALRAELIESDRVAFFAREYPIVAPWGEVGSRLLEATFARDEASFWSLRGYYYEHQGRIRSDDVYERTRQHLEAGGAVNARRVVREVKRGGYERPVARDVAAAKAADVKGTPTFFLFDGDRYLTNIAGAPSYSMLENALDL